MELPWRYLFAVLGAMGMAIIYGQKVNLSVAIVAMVNKTALMAANTSKGEHGPHGTHEVDLEDMCYTPGESDNEAEDGPFVWSEQNQGLVLGSYFWGYLVTQIPGGRIAELFSGKWVFFVAVLMSSIPTMLTPPISYHVGFQGLIFLRIIEGFGGGFTFPAMNVLISKWAPSTERSTLSSIIFGGTALGTVISIPSSGLISGSLGWEWVFYLHGGLALIWCFLWVIFVSDTPDSHKFISETEKQMIASTLPPPKKGRKLAVPWKNILTSVPFWAIVIAHFCNNFGWYMLLVELPLFMGNGLGFAIKENAGLSSVPFICNWLFSIVYSNRLDWARSKGYISTTNARKLSMGIASVIPAICFIAVGLSGCNKVAVVSFMIIGTGFFGAMFSGVFSNHCDIANNFAGLLMGITNMVATIPGFAVPALVGWLTHGTLGLAPWHLVFYTTAGILLFEFVAYSIMASGEEQPWNNPPDPKNQTDEEANEKMITSS